MLGLSPDKDSVETDLTFIDSLLSWKKVYEKQEKHRFMKKKISNIDEAILYHTKIFHPNPEKEECKKYMKDKESDNDTLLFLAEIVCLCFQ